MIALMPYLISKNVISCNITYALLWLVPQDVCDTALLPLTRLTLMCFVRTQGTAAPSDLVFDQLKISSKVLTKSHTRCKRNM